MIALCIKETYHRSGIYRVEYFETKEHLEHYRKDLDKSTVTWILGEKKPFKVHGRYV